MIRGSVALITGAAAFSLAAFLWYGYDTSEKKEDRPLPEFAFKDYAGGEIRSSDFLGKPVILVVWASWCPFCAEELENVSVVKKEFGEALYVIVINRAESRDMAMRGSIASDTATGTVFLLDPNDTYYHAIGGFAMPELIVADRQGMIRFHKRGLLGQEEMRRYIQDLLAF